MEHQENNRQNKELTQEKDTTPIIQVDQHGNPLSNFFINLRKQFEKVQGLGLGKFLMGRNIAINTTEPHNIMGPVKTVIRSDYQNKKKNEPKMTDKKPVFKMDNSIKRTQPNDKKLKL